MLPVLVVLRCVLRGRFLGIAKIKECVIAGGARGTETKEA
jgi:hypothetical protein